MQQAEEMSTADHRRRQGSGHEHLDQNPGRRASRELAETVVIEAEKLIRQHIAQDDQDKMVDDYMGSLARLSQAG